MLGLDILYFITFVSRHCCIYSVLYHCEIIVVFCIRIKQLLYISCALLSVLQSWSVLSESLLHHKDPTLAQSKWNQIN